MTDRLPTEEEKARALDAVAATRGAIAAAQTSAIKSVVDWGVRGAKREAWEKRFRNGRRKVNDGKAVCPCRDPAIKAMVEKHDFDPLVMQAALKACACKASGEPRTEESFDGRLIATLMSNCKHINETLTKRASFWLRAAVMDASDESETLPPEEHPHLPCITSLLAQSKRMSSLLQWKKTRSECLAALNGLVEDERISYKTLRLTPNGNALLAVLIELKKAPESEFFMDDFFSRKLMFGEDCPSPCVPCIPSYAANIRAQLRSTCCAVARGEKEKWDA